MKNRDDIRDQFSPLLDGELSPEERAAMEAVLSGDAELLRELDSLKRVDDLYRALPAEAAPANLEQVVRDRIRPPRAAASPPPYRRAPRRFWAAGLAAAAVVLIGVSVVLFSQNRSTSSTQLAANYGRSAEPVLRNSEDRNEPSLRRKLNEAPSDTAAQSPASAAIAHTDRAAAPPLPAIAGDESAQGMQMESLSKSTLSAEPVSPKQASELSSAEVPIAAMRQQADEATTEDDKDVATSGKPSQRYGNSDSTDTFFAAPKKAPSPTGEMKKREAEMPQPERAQPESNAAGGAGVAPSEMANDALTPGAPASTAPPMAAAESAAPPVAEGVDSREKEAVKAKPERPMLRAKFVEMSPRAIGKRSFTIRDGVWYESGFENQTPKAVQRNSAEANDLLAKHEDLKDVLVLKEPVVLKIAEQWYKISARP